MSSPVIWIILPVFFGVIFWFLRAHRQTTLGLGVGACIVFAILAWSLPLGQVINIGGIRVEISTTLNVLGRRFVLDGSDRTVLVLLFGLGAIWFLGAGFTWAHRFFAPFGMGIIAALVAALAVEPFLYSALLVEVAVLLSIPILAPPGHSVHLGVQRFLLYQTLAMPFILFSGWFVSLGEANPSDTGTLLRAGAFLAMGFAFWLAVFPFNSWMPQLAEETHPYPAGFILTLLPIAVLLIGLGYINSVGWLRSSEYVYSILRIVGIVMIFTGGIWAAFQNNLARLLGYAVILETGYALLALGLHSDMGMVLLVGGILPRVLILFVLSLAFGCLYNHGVILEFSSLIGLAKKLPFATTAVMVCLFSVAGLPLFAAFPTRIELLEQLAAGSFSETLFVLIGNFGFLIVALRVLTRLLTPVEGQAEITGETMVQRVYLTIGILLIILIGIFPGWFHNTLLDLLKLTPMMYPLK